MVTVLGFGGVTGAAKVAELDVAPLPEACVVTEASTPQVVPLHPVPDRVQESAVLGFEPGTGVSVEAMTPEPPEGMLEGAESCREKLLVIVTVAEACLEESATLCAVSVTVAGAGRICGAV
jgi:hypothetical protein